MDLMTKIRSQWDRLLAAAAALAGAVVLVIGWYGVSGTAYPAEQLPYVVSAGVGGLFLLGVSAALWLSADLHDEWRKLDRIERAIRESGMDASEPAAVPGEDHVGFAADRVDDRAPEVRTARVRAGSARGAV